jgi:hypothetical protein
MLPKKGVRLLLTKLATDTVNNRCNHQFNTGSEYSSCIVEARNHEMHCHSLAVACLANRPMRMQPLHLQAWRSFPSSSVPNRRLHSMPVMKKGCNSSISINNSWNQHASTNYSKGVIVWPPHIFSSLIQVFIKLTSARKTARTAATTCVSHDVNKPPSSL